MAEIDLEKEIEILERIIDQLNQCLWIFRQSNSKENLKNTIKDLRICKSELRRLIAAKDAEKEDVKENENDGLSKRSSKTFL